MILLLLLVPVIVGVLILLFFREFPKIRSALLVLTSGIHFLITLSAWVVQPVSRWKEFLALDPMGLFFLSITSCLFLIVSVYGAGYLLKPQDPTNARDRNTDTPFTVCLLFFLSSMTLVVLSQNLEVLWVAIEATTLASAPLIYFYRTPQSLEATWKYFMICSVGIALALLGNFFLAVSAAHASSHSSMVLQDLINQAATLNVPWLKAAFIFLLVGYGTKMGLAPLHTWLPDAHSESPSFVSALLSGALLNCAFVGILRVYQVCVAAHEAAFAQAQLKVLGVVSLTFATAFILKQNDYKRMLAYSSVEHMGILALGVGVGGTAIYGSLLHALNHSFTKGLLFLVSGNILATYHSRNIKVVTGMHQVIPISALLWMVGFLLITGIPPSGIFVSKFIILKSALEHSHWLLTALFLFFLVAIFIGMAIPFLHMVYGSPKKGSPPHTEALWSVLPSLILMVIVIFLGLYIPPFLDNHLKILSATLGAP